jgi:hypothetical protein|uniref:Uncharacterized protein n=1 Tax=Arabidopsis thaliana TaxID=3702 RepID=Q56ZQ6_ARATH|nr:hypothetical protein [Arabidopsis thaliana]
MKPAEKMQTKPFKEETEEPQFGKSPQQFV